MPISAEQTSRQRRLEVELQTLGHQSLEKYVVDHKITGRSWRWIARTLNDLIGSDVTETTLWNWYREAADVAKADTA